MTTTPGVGVRAELADLVRQILAAHPDVMDPRVIADALAGMIPEGSRGSVLAMLLPGFVREVVGDVRRAATAPFVTSQAGRSRMADWAGWQQALEARVHTQDTWKPLAACTVADLRYAAAEREIQAKHLLGRAGFYQRLAGLLDVYGVATVGDLPREVVERELVRA